MSKRPPRYIGVAFNSPRSGGLKVGTSVPTSLGSRTIPNFRDGLKINHLRNHRTPIGRVILLLSILLILQAISCKQKATEPAPENNGQTVPHESRWGIYTLDIATETVELIYASEKEITLLRLSHDGSKFVFSQPIDGDTDPNEEICALASDGSDFRRLTNNAVMDVYPCFSPNDTQIAFLTWRENDLDIYIMNQDGSNQTKLYDSGFHDADIHWWGDRIAFTRNSRIWTMKSDGKEPTQITDPPNTGTWGNAVLPFGDYDPRISPDGNIIAFERMVNDTTVHGNYDIFIINANGTEETRLTQTGYTQGLANWSHAGDCIVYTVSAIGTRGVFDIYMMNANGSDNRNITLEYFPADFLCHCPIFSEDDSKIYFVSEWWE
ncbi:MAG: hypothetical protein ABIL68_11250 [bacterium]